MSMVPNKQLFVNVSFQSRKYRKKELRVDNKVQLTIEVVYCSTCRIEKCFYISTKKTFTFNDCKKCEGCCQVLNVTLKEPKPTFMLFGGDGTHCFARKTNRDYEKEKPSLFLRKFLRQSQSSTYKLETKNV